MYARPILSLPTLIHFHTLEKNSRRKIFVKTFVERLMTLRELIIERILYAVDETTLIRDFGAFPEELQQMNDLELFELFEDVAGIISD